MHAITRFAALAVTVALAVPASAQVGTPGPFAGAVRQGTTMSHAFDNYPPLASCPLVITDYSVQLTYAPATAVLTFSANGRTVTATGGRGWIGFQASGCTRFTITVTGTSVPGPAAAYAVTVRSGSGTR